MFIFIFGILLLIPVPLFAEEASSLANSHLYNLSLDEVSRLALVNNFDIQIAKYDTLISRTQQQVTEIYF